MIMKTLTIAHDIVLLVEIQLLDIINMAIALERAGNVVDELPTIFGDFF